MLLARVGGGVGGDNLFCMFDGGFSLLCSIAIAPQLEWRLFSMQHVDGADAGGNDAVLRMRSSTTSEYARWVMVVDRSDGREMN